MTDDSNLDLSPLRQCLREAAAKSGEIVKHYFSNEITIDNKSDDTPVTIADREAETVIRETVRKHFPNHGIVGEEFGEENIDAEFVWILDPIDGTKSFIARSFDFGTIIGLKFQGEPILGAVNQPVLNQYTEGDNLSATLNGKMISVRKEVKLSEAVLLTTDLLNIGKFHNPLGFNQLTSKVTMSRTWGNCFGYTLVAQGHADIMIDPALNQWDLIGIIPIIRGAGGIITNYYGDVVEKSNSAVAASPAIHSEVIQILNRAI